MVNGRSRWSEGIGRGPFSEQLPLSKMCLPNVILYPPFSANCINENFKKNAIVPQAIDSKVRFRDTPSSWGSFWSVRFAARGGIHCSFAYVTQHGSAVSFEVN